MDGNIFLLGSERSGTNLLRTRLDNHSQICGPTPIHLLKWFYKAVPFYGELENDDNFLVLLKDVVDLVNNRRVPWDIDFDPSIILHEIPKNERHIMMIFKYLYNQYSLKNNKNRWFCKDNNLFDYAWPIKTYFEDAKFIYLVRDPRDVFLSNKNRYSGPKNAYVFSEKWKNEQDKCISIINSFAFQDSVLLIKYEDLISKPKKTFQKVCNFIDVDFENEMLQGKERKESKKTQQWENISGDILEKNYGKFKNELKDNEIKIIEKICDREMKYLNYSKMINNNDYKTSLFKKYYYSAINWLTVKKKVEYDLKKDDIEDYQIRKKWKQINNKIKRRHDL